MEFLIYRVAHVIWRVLTSRAFLRFWIVVGVICVFLAIFFGLPMTGSEFFSKLWVRIAIILLILSPILGLYLFRFLRRRKQARALEESLVEAPAGDGEVLNERFAEALDKLKKSGGKNYLYDLPWYVIIGPPGAGKTTALKYSGIEFPGQEVLADNAQGFGGTKNVDWWFAEDAVLIDTAGRYTMQESDAEADQASWSAFLDLLKKGRPDQPINGVVLAFSIEDILTGTPETLASHAAVVRERLGEIHQTLRIDFPVYVLFTKADLISGFREYFNSFSQSRRKMVWGTTFQTRDRREATHAHVGEEFDALLTRLSDEVVDRMVEEPDDTSRIAIFGLPGQMAMLRDNVVEFLRRVFEPTRYDTNAILRGFYFSSGTQEGTPIDQVLGAMARDEGEGFQPAFMSGKGKSYFLHDVLAKVIFEERDWVNFDRRAVRRMAILRTLGFAVIGLGTVAAMTAFGYSFWQNANLVSDAEAHAAVYLDSARNELDRAVIDDPDPTPVIPHLDGLRNMPAGYGNPHEPTLWEGFGLNRSREIATSARAAYSDGLERMLRPRMMLHLENEIPQMIIDDDTEGTYRALKVYMLLAKDPEAKGDGDEAIRTYFRDAWDRMMPGATRFDERQALFDHLEAMLQLDDAKDTMVKTDETIKTRARESIVNLPLADQAYAAIKEGAIVSGVADFNLVERVSGNVGEVFRTTDGSPLDQLGVPGLYTFEGYWGYFVDEMADAKKRLAEEQWVLGETGDRVNFDTQLANLENELFSRYRREFTLAWNGMFDQLTVAKMSADAPNFTLLSYAASPTNSPILELAEAVNEETDLMRLYDQIGGISEADAARLIAGGGGGGDLGGALGDAAFDRIYSRSGVFTRVILENLGNRAKIQTRAGSGGLAEDVDRRRVQRITDDFKDWQSLVKGDFGNRPIDFMLKAYASVQENRSNAVFAPTPADDQMLSQALTALTRTNAGAPEAIATMNSAVATEFRTAAENATLADLNRALNDEVTQFCKNEIAPFYPFSTGSARHLSPSIFGQFFGPGGKMDQFYSQHLAPYVIRETDGLRADPGTAVGQRLSANALRQFDRAQKIQRAFFASGSSTPEVNMSIKHVTSSPGVGLATLTIHGKSIPTQPDSTPAGFSWPGETAGVQIDLIPTRIGDAASFSFSQGRWDIAKWLSDGSPKVQGNVVTVRYTIRGQSITYRIEFDSSTVPFLMRELRDFSCPTSLE
ncbi:type VI secretion system membrane subunit TssM [Sagittula salina]|uniref:Type VI secretion system membrane subunit TssM n=1 Tax=Sagittula salina TaxID=2820268 RepID=A0A940MN61_9RHOB|nr:type VI secretion system membrane subunit TssM [Sagittula salina]MBP0484975.1 type VI secretion system membrane subunit TssM [Sagittula salina]